MISCKMFGFIKKHFFTGLIFLLTLTGVNLLSFISMSSQEMKNNTTKLLTLIVKSFFLLALKQVNAAVVATIPMIHMQNCVFLL